MRQCLLERAVGEQNAELLAAVSIRRASALDRREAGGDELQHLVADVMAVVVVELLEMVHVYHPDGVGRTEAREALLERAAAGQVRQFVAEGEAVRFLEHGREQDHARGRHERAERERRRCPFAADEECDQRRRDAHVERPRLLAQFLGPATGPCSRQGRSERRDEHDSRDDRRRRRAQQPVIEHVAPRRSREARAAGIRDPDHHQDFSQAQQNPAIIPILTHPALRKGEREQHVEGHDHGERSQHRLHGETLRTQVPGQAVAGVGGQKRRQHDERAAAVEPRADGRPEQQHDIRPHPDQAGERARKRVACRDRERGRQQDHGRHRYQLQSSKE